MMAVGAAVIWGLEWTGTFQVAASCALPLGWDGWKAEIGPSSGMVQWTLRVDPGPPFSTKPIHVTSSCGLSNSVTRCFTWFLKALQKHKKRGRQVFLRLRPRLAWCHSCYILLVIVCQHPSPDCGRGTIQGHENWELTL